MLCIFMHALFNAAHATVYIHNNTLTQFTIENWTSADNGNGFKVLVKRKEISNLLYKIFIFSFRFRVSKKKKKQSRHLIQNPKFSLTHALCSKLKPWSNVASNNRLDDFHNALHKISSTKYHSTNIFEKKNTYANKKFAGFFHKEFLYSCLFAWRIHTLFGRKLKAIHHSFSQIVWKVEIFSFLTNKRFGIFQTNIIHLSVANIEHRHKN